jgi:excisionase family DNA binding protein
MNTHDQLRKRLLRVREASAYVGISAWKIRQLVAGGHLPIVQDDEHAPFLIDVADLDAWIERSKHRRSDSP